MKTNKVNKKLLQKASDIAHGLFWISDCPEILKQATSYIENTNVIYPKKKQDLLPYYVSIICHFCAIRRDS